MSRRQYMVHSYDSERIVFRGTQEECLTYINENYPDNLELYWADLGDSHYREDLEEEE